MKKAKLMSRETIYTSPWVSLHVDRVKFPGGKIVNRHHVVELMHRGVAALLTNNKDQILLIRSFRHTVDSVEWEIPAGGVNPKENIFKAAEREVLEETGYEAHDFKKVYTYFPMTGISNAVCHIVVAKAGKKIAKPDPNEVGGIAWKTRSQICSMIKKNKIKDGFSLTALLFWRDN